MIKKKNERKSLNFRGMQGNLFYLSVRNQPKDNYKNNYELRSKIFLKDWYFILGSKHKQNLYTLMYYNVMCKNS